MPQKNIVSFPAPASAAKPRHKRRADGLFQAKARYKSVDGLSHEKCFYGKTYAEAAAKKKQFLAALESGADPDQMNITVSAFVERWLTLRAAKDQGRKTTQNIDTHRREAQRLVQAYGARPLRSITRSDMERLLASRAGLSASAISATRCTLGQIFRAARADRLIQENPMDAAESPAGPSGSHRALEPWEQALITAHWRGHRMGPMAMLMLYAGLRRGEACALRWENVDLAGNVIHVREAISFHSGRSARGVTKTAAGLRDVPILPPLRPVLESISRPSGPVCLSASGEELTQSACERGWESFLVFLAEQKCGCPRRWVAHYNQEAALAEPSRYSAESPKYTWQAVNIRMHDLRHTFCTILFDADVDIKAAQYLMGHSSAAVTLEIYNHLSAVRSRAALDRLTEYTRHFSAPE